MKSKLTQGQKSFIPKLRELGLTYEEIGKLYGVAKETAYRYCFPDKHNASARKHLRSSTLGTTINGKHVLLRGLKKRLHPGDCELCGKRRRLSYHHWDDTNPSIGLWLCFGCHMLAERLEKQPEFVESYNSLKDKAKAEQVELMDAEFQRMRRSLDLHKKTYSY